MTITNDESNPAMSLAARFAGPLSQTYEDLSRLSRLHPEFVKECLTAIDVSRARLRRPSTGEIFPHLVAQSLTLDDKDRRALMAAWLALLGYICIVDHELDQKGYITGQKSIAASALLGWGVATLGRYTTGTPFASVFLDSINRAFAGQYEDIQLRSSTDADRQRSDKDKNRACLAAVAGFCAAAREPDDHMVRSAEALLGPFQILDDLEDLEEDEGQENITIFVRIAREYISTVKSPSRMEMYRAIIGDARTVSALRRAAAGFEKALLLLDSRRDLALIEYIGEMRIRTIDLVSVLDDYQRDRSPIKEPEIMRRIEQVASGCT